MLRYTLPIGAREAKVIFDLGAMHYDVISSEVRHLDPTGRSFTRGIGISYPLITGRTRNLTATASYARDDLRNEIRGQKVSDYHSSALTLGLEGDVSDRIAGGGVTRFALSYATGTTAGTDIGGDFDDDFDIWRFYLSREQYLSERWTLFAQLSGQKGPRGLDSSEEFILGGPYGVRAYPIGEGSGPSGAVANLELRYRLNGNWTLTGFYDHGWIGGRTAEGEPESYRLKGFGAKISWAHRSGWTADLTLAKRIGDNPNPLRRADGSRSHKDQDGSSRDPRIWFEIHKIF